MKLIAGGVLADIEGRHVTLDCRSPGLISKASCHRKLTEVLGVGCGVESFAACTALRVVYGATAGFEVELLRRESCCDETLSIPQEGWF